MKKSLLFSAFIAAFLFLAQVNASSCTKKTVITVHDTTTIVDTVPLILPSNTQDLSSHIWEVYELYQVIGGDTSHYLRGIINTTGSDQDVQRFTFNQDGSGTYIGPDSTTYNLAWQFLNPDQTSMHLVATNGSTNLTYNWELVSISDSAIYETTPESNGIIVSAKLVPVPVP